MKEVLLEGALVGLVGAVVAFAANGLSPQGLKLTRDYFPGAPKTHTSAPAGTNATVAANNTNQHALSPDQILAARLRQNGLSLIATDEVLKLFRDPRREQNLVVFIDARPDNQYLAGHIPGAYQFYHFQAENYLATVVPVCQIAQQIVVYCHGGECEDSESAAVMLTRDAGIAKEKLFVYGGGITEWTDRGLPIEAGPRTAGKTGIDTK